jgi:hypothetical protein
MPARQTSPETPPRALRSDLVLSVLLPAIIIALGVAMSIGTEGIAAVVDLCLGAVR